ncbi:uncharacterized protein AAEQ78_022059 [Lycaon pictus]
MPSSSSSSSSSQTFIKDLGQSSEISPHWQDYMALRPHCLMDSCERKGVGSSSKMVSLNQICLVQVRKRPQMEAHRWKPADHTAVSLLFPSPTNQDTIWRRDVMPLVFGVKRKTAFPGETGVAQCLPALWRIDSTPLVEWKKYTAHVSYFHKHISLLIVQSSNYPSKTVMKY